MNELENNIPQNDAPVEPQVQAPVEPQVQAPAEPVYQAPVEPQQPVYQQAPPQYQAAPQYEAAPQYQAPAAGRLPSKSKEKLVAGLLALFLGTLGIHKFYLGYTKEGVIMLLVSIIGGLLFGVGTAVMAVIALVEAILYLTKSDEDFDNIYVIGNKGWF